MEVGISADAPLYDGLIPAAQREYLLVSKQEAHFRHVGTVSTETRPLSLGERVVGRVPNFLVERVIIYVKRLVQQTSVAIAILDSGGIPKLCEKNT